MNDKKDSNKSITRVDLVSEGEWVKISQWFDGWKPGDPPAEQTSEKANIYQILASYEGQGFTVEMCDATHGRALRGEITRIDFQKIAGRWTIKKYPYGWTATTRPISEETKPAEWDAEKEAFSWLEKNHWIVRTWPGGARAFKGEPMPIRDRLSIVRLRSRLEKEFQQGHFDNLKNYDLAFDL
jgi:hypothetical protein